LNAIKRNLADAGVERISDEARFDLAYKAAMQCTLVALHVNGFRPSTSEPGHQATAIQTLPLTLGISDQDWRVLDALRRKRSAGDYAGDTVTAGMVEECQQQAKALFRRLRAHLRDKHSGLIR
jgi:mannose/cellobiose epimerase-like protein (N-acyl-D-glucosamine 2-epimerase family)